MEPGNQAYLDRAFIRRWKTKIYRFLEKEKGVTQLTSQKMKESEIIKIVVERFIHDF